MNERQFLKTINARSNDTGSFTYAEVLELIEENNKPSVNAKVNIFERLFNFRKKSVKEIIGDNFEHILDRCCDDYVGELLIALWNNADTKDIVCEKFGSILERFKNNELSKDEEFWALGIQQEKFLRELSKSDEGKELIKDNFEDILQSIPKNHLFETAQNMKNISLETDDVLEQYLQENSRDIARSLLYNNRRISFCYGIDQLADDYTDTILIMIKELLESENARWIDIASLGSGGYSCVYQIGDKVLKIGSNRGTYQIPNHTRILQPLTRINLLNEKNNNATFAVVEIADKVDELKKEDHTEENLYAIYRELREDGIVWTDARFQNVGVLKKLNRPSLHGENMNVAPNSVGFVGNIRGKELHVGDKVILDTDYIYYQDDPEIAWLTNGFSRAFEKRWQQEYLEKISKKYANQRQGQKVEGRGEGDERY